MNLSNISTWFRSSVDLNDSQLDPENTPMETYNARSFRGPEPLDFENAGNKWLIWKQQFEVYMLASGGNDTKELIKIATFLHHLGPRGIEVYNTIMDRPFTSTTPTGTEEKLEDVIKKFDEYCMPKKNVVMESFKFHTIKQKENQPVTEFVTELRTQLPYCAFKCTCNVSYGERMLRDRIILGIADKRLQLKLLDEKDISLDSVIEKCKVAELAKANKSLLAEPISEKKEDRYVDAVGEYKSRKPTAQCFRFGYPYVPGHQQKCPANREGQVCYKCNQPGHFARFCKHLAHGSKSPAMERKEDKGETKSKEGQKVNENSTGARKKVNELRYTGFYYDSGITNNIIHIDALNLNKDRSDNNEDGFNPRIENIGGWKKTLTFANRKITFKLDTGADISCIPIDTIEHIGCRKLISGSVNSLFAYNNNKIESYGKITLLCLNEKLGRKLPIDFEVVEKGLQPILGVDACVTLSLVKRIDRIESMPMPETKEEFVIQNSDIFEGLGKMPGKCHIVLKPDSTPNLKYKKRIPASLIYRLKQQVTTMVKDGVLSRVDYPTDWVNNLQLIEKSNGMLRLCLDPVPLNACIKREHLQIPTAEEIIGRLSNKRVFTVLDLKNGFWELELDESSSNLTTFMTPFGRFKWNRLPFGLNCAPEMFLKSMWRVFGDIEGVEIYFDDLCISGKDKIEHDRVLRKVLERARANSVKFNSDKIQYRKSEVTFMGQVVSANRVSPDEKYYKAIRELPLPKDKKGVLRLLGLYKFLARFIPNLSKRTANLRNLTRLDVSWEWKEEHTNEVNDLMTTISQGPVLAIYDPESPLVIQTDSSKDGLGSVLLQNGRPVAYASRSLTKSEQKWAQIEKEALAIAFSLERFHYFVYGRDCEVHSDHKPLETL